MFDLQKFCEEYTETLDRIMNTVTCLHEEQQKLMLGMIEKTKTINAQLYGDKSKNADS